MVEVPQDDTGNYLGSIIYPQLDADRKAKGTPDLWGLGFWQVCLGVVVAGVAWE